MAGLGRTIFGEVTLREPTGVGGDTERHELQRPGLARRVADENLVGRKRRRDGGRQHRQGEHRGDAQPSDLADHRDASGRVIAFHRSVPSEVGPELHGPE